MPRLGLTMAEGTVVEWHAQPGDAVERGTALLVVESEKAQVEVEAFASANTEFEAIELLKADIANLYLDLTKTPPEKLGRAPKRWLEVLSLLIQ